MWLVTVEAKLTIRPLPVEWVKAKVRQMSRSQESDDAKMTCLTVSTASN